MWSIEYVQVPAEERDGAYQPVKEVKEEPAKPADSATKPLSIHNRLVKQVNISNESAGSLIKSGSESSLSEDNATRRSSVDRQRSGEGSSKEWRSEQQDEKETCSDTEDSPPVIAVRRRRSRVHGGFRKSEGIYISKIVQYK